MPTRKGGPRQPRQRIERVEPPKRPTATGSSASGASVPGKAPARNPLFPVGVSLYALESETLGPDEWYARDVTEDLDALSQARCALVRIFVSWRVLEPQVGQYNEAGLKRLAEIVAAARTKKMQSLVCFFADDRHAELSDVGWGKRRDPRTDSYLLQREVALAAKVVSYLDGDAGIFGWQLGNEAFLAGFESSDTLESWLESLREAIREIDPKRPIGLGADAETLYRSSGVDARQAIATCEFAVSHVTAAYHAYAAEGPLTSGPTTYLDGFLLRMAHRGAPVLLDDAGTILLDASAGEEAAHLRTVLWSGLTNRAAGVLARRFRDMDTERREPYFLDPFETLVGIADSEGIIKPTYDVMRRFIRTTAAIDFKSHQLIAERSAVIVPAERYEPLPSLAGLYDPRACLQSFITAKRAHVPVTVIHEEDPYDDYLALMVPGAFALNAETWERLAAFVQAGGTLLYSYGGGDAPAALRDLFGVEFLGDGGPRSTLSCRVAQDEVLGALESFDAMLEIPNYALLGGGAATIVATDAKGSPLLTVNQIGQGKAVLVAAPVERAIAQDDPWATPAPVLRFVREVYGAVARNAGCGAPVQCDVPEIEIGLFQGDNDDVLVLLNHSDEKVTVNLSTERRVASIADVRGGSPVAVGGTSFGLPIEGSGAVALRMNYA